LGDFIGVAELQALREEVMNSNRLSLVSVIVAAVLLPAVGASAMVRYVALDGSGADGKTWATAYRTIQAALNDPLVVGGSEIHVKQGVYSVTSAIAVKKAVYIYGSYSGVDENRNWAANPTWVDGGATASCFIVTANATIDNMGIKNGAATGNGGGMSISGCTATLSNCAFTGNKCEDFGGAIATLQATGTRILNCTFTQNSASQSGGAIYNSGSTGVQITGCTFTQNNATSDSGGAIYNLNSTGSITSCLIQGNWAAEVAGGILNEKSSPTITGCTFGANRAQYGAGMFNYYSSPTVADCLFTNCDLETVSGGGVYTNGGAPTFKSCLFQRNYVQLEGGGMMTQGATGKTINCVFWRNSAVSGGGGIYLVQDSDANSPGNPQFINCTVYGNATSWRGGAVYSESTSGAFTNCILWGNTATNSYPGIYSEAGLTAGKPVAQYCDIEGTSLYPGTGNRQADPRLVDPNTWDFGLAFDSSCIDTGSNAAVAGIVNDYTDEGARVVDGNGDGIAVVDMGACELQGQPDHLTSGEIMQSVAYDSPSDSTPTYTFLLRLQTDDALTSVEFQVPGGSTVYQIPSDSHTSSGNVQTYHRVASKKVHLWEYWATASTASGLAAYGNGTYRVTAHYRDHSQVEIQVVYFVPGTSTAIPQPVQKPEISAPAYGANVGSPVTLQWGACTDAAANSVFLTILDVNAIEVAGEVLAKTATQSSEWTVSEGSYGAEIGFANRYQVNGSDGTPFEIGRAAVVGSRFTVPYLAVYHFLAPSTKAHFFTVSGEEKKKVIAESSNYWTYQGIAFNAWKTKSSNWMVPVYRFWSGRSYFYTTSEMEKSKILTMWPKFWKLEGVAFYAYPEGLEPEGCKAVYRFWNTKTLTHYFTIDEVEATRLMAEDLDLYYERVAFYAFPP
jgi:predicted outer membrane repeat protein